MMPVLHSTKNLKIIEPPTAAKEGVGVFGARTTTRCFITAGCRT